jgi:outer membrane protein OmpA-like peptidoglycan-associated protein
VKQFIRRRPKAKFDVWPVVYIDLMTQIMMFFVILWSISQMQARSAGVSKAVGDTTLHEINLPGDVLFPAGKTKLTTEGVEVFGKLFQDDTGEVLNFDTGGLTRRVLVIHGHTDSDGKKLDNYVLGFHRALSVYEEIQKYGPEIVDHAVLCTHADNSPAKDVPQFSGAMTPAQAAALGEAKAKNRRITIEDQVNSVLKEE